MTSGSQLPIVSIATCAGRFCGCATQNSTTCSACPWGSRSEPSLSEVANCKSYCQPCTTPPSFREYFCLGVNFLLPVLIFLVAWTQTLKVSPTARSVSRQGSGKIEPLLAYTSSADVEDEKIGEEQADEETVQLQNFCPHKPWPIPVICILLHTLAFLLVFLLFPPTGSLTLFTCKPRGLEDFYSVFVAGADCASEAAFPFLSLPLVYYLVSAILSVPVYCIFIAWCGIHDSHLNVIWFALYTYPLLAVAHFIFSGLQYFIFHFFLLIMALLYSTYRFPQLFDYIFDPMDDPKSSDRVYLTPARDLSASCRYIRHAGRVKLVTLSTGLITLTIAYALLSFSREAVSYWLLPFALSPVVFYLVTLPLTHPFVYFDGRQALQAVGQLSTDHQEDEDGNDG